MPLDLIQYQGRFHSAMLRAFGGHLIAASDQVLASFIDTVAGSLYNIYLITAMVLHGESRVQYSVADPIIRDLV